MSTELAIEVKELIVEFYDKVMSGELTCEKDGEVVPDEPKIIAFLDDGANKLAEKHDVELEWLKEEIGKENEQWLMQYAIAEKLKEQGME